MGVGFGERKDVRVASVFTAFAPGKPANMRLPDKFLVDIKAKKQVTTFLEWMNSCLLSSEQHACIAAVPQIGIQVQLRKAQKDLCDHYIWGEKTADPTKKHQADLLNTIYQFQCVACKPASTSTSPTVYAMAEIRLYISGGDIIGGIPFPEDPTVSFKEWCQRVECMEGANLAKELSYEKAWIATANAGDIIAIPSGYLIVSIQEKGATHFRNSVPPSFPDEDARVKIGCTKLLEAHPELQRGTWSEWHSFLQKASA